jgi:hypothetical protein
MSDDEYHDSAEGCLTPEQYTQLTDGDKAKYFQCDCSDVWKVIEYNDAAEDRLNRCDYCHRRECDNCYDCRDSDWWYNRRGYDSIKVCGTCIEDALRHHNK